MKILESRHAVQGLDGARFVLDWNGHSPGPAHAPLAHFVLDRLLRCVGQRITPLPGVDIAVAETSVSISLGDLKTIRGRRYGVKDLAAAVDAYAIATDMKAFRVSVKRSEVIVHSRSGRNSGWTLAQWISRIPLVSRDRAELVAERRAMGDPDGYGPFGVYEADGHEVILKRNRNYLVSGGVDRIQVAPASAMGDEARMAQISEGKLDWAEVDVAPSDDRIPQGVVIFRGAHLARIVAICASEVNLDGLRHAQSHFVRQIPSGAGIEEHADEIRILANSKTVPIEFVKRVQRQLSRAGHVSVTYAYPAQLRRCMSSMHFDILLDRYAGAPEDLEEFACRSICRPGTHSQHLAFDLGAPEWAVAMSSRFARSSTWHPKDLQPLPSRAPDGAWVAAQMSQTVR